MTTGRYYAALDRTGGWGVYDSVVGDFVFAASHGRDLRGAVRAAARYEERYRQHLAWRQPWLRGAEANAEEHER